MCYGRPQSIVLAVDSHVLSDFMHQVGASVDKLDEMLNVFDNVSDNMQESGQDRMHQVINNAVQLVSQFKGNYNLPLGAVGKWLHHQHLDLEREETDDANDDYDFPDVRLRALLVLQKVVCDKSPCTLLWRCDA
jgi:hypothetical protein